MTDMSSKTIFLSLPMNGLSDAQIAANISGMTTAIKNAYGIPESQIYNNFNEKIEDVKEYNNTRVALLSRAIEKMAKCDTVAFFEGWEKANGCIVEYEVAKRYGFEIFFIDKEYNIHNTIDLEYVQSAIKAVDSIRSLAKIQDKEKLIVKYLKEKHEGFISKMEKHGNFIDLSSASEITIAPESYALIPLGVAMKLPAGYYAEVVPRSSTFKKYGIIMANSTGIIDTEYCGDDDEWHFPAYNTRKEAVTIPINERICQFTIKEEVPIELYTLADGENLGGPNRGGFGSTDEKSEKAE